MELEVSIVISQILAFLIMLWILKKFAWKPFLKLVQERKTKIEQGFQSIERQKEELQQLTESYHTKIAEIDETAKQSMRKAIEHAEIQAQQISEEAQRQAKALLEKTKSAIAHEVEQAHQQLRERVVDLVIQTSEKLLHEKIEPEEEKKKISAWIGEVNLQ